MSKKTGNNKTHDRNKLKQDFLKSKHVSVSARGRAQFGVVKGKHLPGYIGRNTKGRAKEKNDIGKEAFQEARDEVKANQRTKRVDTLNRASDNEREVIDFISSIVEHNLIEKIPDFIDTALSIYKMDFILKALRTAQGKANEYLGGELEEKSPLDKRLEEMGLLDQTRTK